MDIKRKLTSRKFWLAVIGFVTGIMLYLGRSAEEANKLGELILAGASVIAYVIGEGLADSANSTHTEDENTILSAKDEDDLK